MGYRKRVDRPHSDIVQALRQCGWHVQDTSRLGGFVDLVCARAGRLEMIEIKDGDKALSRQALTPAEARTHRAFAAAGVTVRLVRSVEDAVAL